MSSVTERTRRGVDEALYSSYGRKIMWATNHDAIPPAYSADLRAVEEMAKSKLPLEYYNFAAGGAGYENTVQANRDAFDNWRIVPRVLREVKALRNLKTNLFGRQVPAPVIMAPIGAQTMYDPEGERAVAKVFGELGLPFTLSIGASAGFATAAKANGPTNPHWFQLYWPGDRDLCASLLKSARASGYEVLVLTIDTWQVGWRPRDMSTGFSPFLQGIGGQIGMEDEYQQAKLGFDASRPDATIEQKKLAAAFHIRSVAMDHSPTWEDMLELRKMWGDRPIVLKGIQTVEDAELAVEYGMDGIIVSNHGGRQVDGGIASLDVLVPIVDAVKGKLTVGFDSGIRNGADIFKTLALGADFVSLGRPILWGLASGGEEGVGHVLKSILADFDLTVGLAGCRGREKDGSSL